MIASMIINWVSKCMILKVSGLFIFTLYFFFFLLLLLFFANTVHNDQAPCFAAPNRVCTAYLSMSFYGMLASNEQRMCKKSRIKQPCKLMCD